MLGFRLHERFFNYEQELTYYTCSYLEGWICWEQGVSTLPHSLRIGWICDFYVRIIIEYVYWLAGSARQLLFSVILSWFICLSIYLRLFTELQPADAWRSVSKIAYGQTTGVYVIYSSEHYVGVTNMSLHYNLSAAVKICRRYWRMESGSASQRDYRLVYNCN